MNRRPPPTAADLDDKRAHLDAALGFYAPARPDETAPPDLFARVSDAESDPGRLPERLPAYEREGATPDEIGRDRLAYSVGYRIGYERTGHAALTHGARDGVSDRAAHGLDEIAPFPTYDRAALSPDADRRRAA